MQPASQAGQHRIRVAAVAVEHPVGRALKAQPQRLEEHRDGAGRGEGDDRLGVAAQDGVEDQHHPGVHREPGGEQPAVDQ